MATVPFSLLIWVTVPVMASSAKAADMRTLTAITLAKMIFAALIAASRFDIVGEKTRETDLVPAKTAKKRAHRFVMLTQAETIPYPAGSRGRARTAVGRS